MQIETIGTNERAVSLCILEGIGRRCWSFRVQGSNKDALEAGLSRLNLYLHGDSGTIINTLTERI